MDSIKLSNRKYIIKGFESKVRAKNKSKQKCELEFLNERISLDDELYMSPEILFAFKNRNSKIQFTYIDPSGDKSFLQGALDESSVLEPSFMGPVQEKQQQLELNSILNELGFDQQQSSEDPRSIEGQFKQSAFYLHSSDIYSLGMVMLNIMTLGQLGNLFKQAKEQNIPVKALFERVLDELIRNGFQSSVGVIKEMIKEDYSLRANQRKLKDMIAGNVATRPSETRFKQQLQTTSAIRNIDEYQFQKGLEQYKIRSFYYSYKILKQLVKKSSCQNENFEFYYQVIIALGSVCIQLNFIEEALDVVEDGQKELLSLVQFNIKRQNEIYLKLMILKLEILIKSKQLTQAQSVLNNFWKLAKYYWIEQNYLLLQYYELQGKIYSDLSEHQKAIQSFKLALKKLKHKTFNICPFYRETLKAKLLFQIGREQYLFNEFESALTQLTKLKNYLQHKKSNKVYQILSASIVADIHWHLYSLQLFYENLKEVIDIFCEKNSLFRRSQYYVKHLVLWVDEFGYFLKFVPPTQQQQILQILQELLLSVKIQVQSKHGSQNLNKDILSYLIAKCNYYIGNTDFARKSIQLCLNNLKGIKLKLEEKNDIAQEERKEENFESLVSFSMDEILAPAEEFNQQRSEYEVNNEEFSWADNPKKNTPLPQLWNCFEHFYLRTLYFHLVFELILNKPKNEAIQKNLIWNGIKEIQSIVDRFKDFDGDEKAKWLMNLAIVWGNCGGWDEALQCLKKALIMLDQFKNNNEVCRCNMLIGQFTFWYLN